MYKNLKMEKTYQPEVIELADKIIGTLHEDGFFTESGIEHPEPAKPVICDFLTEKFIAGKLVNGSVETNDEEFRKVLGLVIAECTLRSLTKKGFTNSVEDENGEEVFFLTEKGKSYHKNMKRR